MSQDEEQPLIKALDSITPYDDQHRKKLAELREKLLAQPTAKEVLERAQSELKLYERTDLRQHREAMSNSYVAARGELRQAFEAQNQVIAKIVEAVTKRV